RRLDKSLPVCVEDGHAATQQGISSALLQGRGLDERHDVRQFLLPPRQLAGQVFVKLLDGPDAHGLKILRPSGIVLETREDARIPDPDFEVNCSFCQTPSMIDLMSRLT